MGYAKDGDLMRPLNLFQRMQDRGIALNIVTYHILRHGFCEVGRLDVAEKLFSVLLQKKMPITVKT